MVSSVLDVLGRRNGTDKASNGHDYCHWYERFLAPWRDREMTILEIGVGDGGSLRMWRDYFPRARIVGMDIDDSKRHHASERIEIVIGDQGDDEALNRIEKEGPFGVIVDDAGHHDEYQIKSHRRLLSSLLPGGLYILEDISGSTINYLADLAVNTIRGSDSGIESIALYRDTSITTMRQRDDDNAAADRFAQIARDHFRHHIEANR